MNSDDIVNRCAPMLTKQKFFFYHSIVPNLSTFFRESQPIRNYQVFTSTLFEMIDKAVGFVMSRIDARVGTRDQSTDAPVEYELPESVVAEAIANAVAHRDYTSNGSVQVMLFRDRLEVWNPGRLPDGFTVQKLREIHSSEPTNPVIAHPLFLTGYIEHLGTGTTDMIADCAEYGLRSPEFIQAEDFRTIIWRKVSNPAQKVSNLSEKVSDFSKKTTEQDGKSNRVSLTAKQQTVLEFCNETPRTAREIIEMIGVKYHTKTLEQYINKLVYAGLLRPTSGKSHDQNRKYITAHNGE